jgi:4-azaleucine resistance transporter AzlC
MNTTTSTLQQPAERTATTRISGPISAERRAVASGVRAMLPWLTGVIPLGLMIGMTAAGSGHSASFALLTGLTIYAGSAQFAAIELTADGASLAVVVISVLAINARLLLYGSAMAAHWKDAPRRFRVAAAYMLIDPSFAEGDRRYRSEPVAAHWFYIGTAVTLWVAWQTAIVAGAMFGNLIPSAARLEHVLPLYLVAELATVVRGRGMAETALAGGLVSMVAIGLPMHSGLIVAIAVGVVTGARVDGSSR